MDFSLVSVCGCNQAKEVALWSSPCLPPPLPLSSFVVEEKWRLLPKLSPACVLASSLWRTLPQTWRKMLWLKATAANSHGFFFFFTPFVCVCMCFNVSLYARLPVHVHIRLNAVGPSVSEVSVIRIISKSHQAEPLISHLAWWTPRSGEPRRGDTSRSCLSFSLTLSVCLSVRDSTCLFPGGLEGHWVRHRTFPSLEWIQYSTICARWSSAGHWYLKIQKIRSYSSWVWLVPSSVVNAGFARTSQLMFHDWTAQYLTSCGRNYTKMIRERIGRLYIFWNGSNKAA